MEGQEMAKGSTWFKIKREKIKQAAIAEKCGTCKRWTENNTPKAKVNKVGKIIAAQRQAAKQARRDSKCGLIQRHK